MPIPTQGTIELYLLHEVEAMGGAVNYRVDKEQLLARLRKYFPEMTDEEANEPTPKTKAPRFRNNVEWARNALVNKYAFLERGPSGQWGPVSVAGRAYLAENWPPREKPIYGRSKEGIISNSSLTHTPIVRHPVPDPVREQRNEDAESLTLSRLMSANRAETKRLLKERLLELSPGAFEELMGLVLSYTGFSEVEITGRTNDGGIDGLCKQPLLGLTVPFQAKRWTNNQVNGEVVAAFRGRVLGKYPRGVFITTSSFTPGGKEAAQSDVELIDGDRLVEFMFEKRIGIREEAVTYTGLDDEFFLKFRA